MEPSITIEELAAEIGAVTSASDARALLNRAQRIAGVRKDRPLRVQELLHVCEALAAEGGVVQQIAELIARRALEIDLGGGPRRG